MATDAKKKPTKSKKPASKKKTSKSAAAKSTKTVSKATKKSNVKVSSKKEARRTLTPLERLRSLHISSFLAYLIFAVLSVFLIGNASSQVLFNYQAPDVFENVDGEALSSANEVLFTLEYRYILIAVLVLGAVFSILLATYLRKQYEEGIKAKISGYRWLFFGITAGTLVWLVSFMGGVQDLLTLELSASLVFLAAFLGWLTERENFKAKSIKKVAFIGAVFASIVAVLPLLGSLIGTSLFGDASFGWEAYALSGIVILSLLANLLNQEKSLINKAKLEYVVYEQRYVRIDQVTKFLVVLVMIASLK